MIEQFLENLLQQGLEKYHGDTELALAWARTKLESFLHSQPEMSDEMVEEYLQQIANIASDI